MRDFSNEEAIAISGLTRGQIDQFIARWGYGVYGKRGAFGARQFCATDIFNFMLVQVLQSLGMPMASVRDIVIGGLGLYRWDTSLDRPVEVFPGQALDGKRQSLVIFFYQDQWHVRVADPADAPALHAPRGSAAVVIDATALVERVEAAAKSLAR